MTESESNMKKQLFVAVCAVVIQVSTAAVAAGYPISPVEMSKVIVTHGFWFDRMETNRTATLKSNWDKCFETPRIANITNAAARNCHTFGGIPFDDSDVFKMMEGTAYILASHPDKELEQRMIWLIDQIAKAQEPDGYLYTARTLLTCDEGMTGWMMGPIRWFNIPYSHELYNVGHMYEAAAAWHRVTGRTDFLKVAEKNAFLIGNTFGPGEFQIKEVPGHEEIELALCKLYLETGKPEHLALAKWFVDAKGRGKVNKDGKAVVFNTEGDLKASDEMTEDDSYRQNHRLIADQRSAVGHAVRAAYIYCGAADVAALTGDKSYDKALDAIWEDVVGSKMHITGGIGSNPNGEAFGKSFELPNDFGETYLETCAAIGNALWNQRMFLKSGESKYVDVLERTIYNGFVSGISLTGNLYFYPNPLATTGGYERVAWFGCSCCPVNDIRVVPQIPSFAYASSKDAIYWNLFLAGKAEVGGLKFSVETDYPWNGEITLKIDGVTAAAKGKQFKIRIPGWAVGKPVPSTLYRQTEESDFNEIEISVNGYALNGCPGLDGYVSIGRDWKVGDVVKVVLPMPVKRIVADERVEADRGRMAVEKGPIVYCAEGVDNPQGAYAAVLPADATFKDAAVTVGDKQFPALKASTGLTLVPYSIWGNRQPGNDLQVWFKTK